MGYAFHELIPPAILLDNPGLTRDQFQRRIQSTNSSPSTEFTSEDPWDSHLSWRHKLDSESFEILLGLGLSESEGNFQIIFGGENFRWKAKDGRYFLDNETFNHIPVSFFESLSQKPEPEDLSFGYTDLILTAEAIKHGAWKLLSRRGLKHLEDFLRDFPDSRERYEKAVYDSYSSLFAKAKGLTNTELLRLRLTGQLPQEEPPGE